MDPKPPTDIDKIDEVAEQLDDIKLTVDEIADAQNGIRTEAVDRLQKAVDEAIEAADQLEDLRDQEPTISLHLEELASLVEGVARERDIVIHVVGVVPSEGGGTYAEVVIAREGEQPPLSIGLHRDRAVDELRQHIASVLLDLDA